MFLYWEDKTTKLLFSLKDSNFSLIFSKTSFAFSLLSKSLTTKSFVDKSYTSTETLNLLSVISLTFFISESLGFSNSLKKRQYYNCLKFFWLA